MRYLRFRRQARRLEDPWRPELTVLNPFADVRMIALEPRREA